MKTRKLIILTEGGEEFGFGHIMRCLSICRHFEFFKFKVEFVVNGDSSICTVLEEYSLSLENWLENDILFTQLSSSDFILIDSLQVTDIFLQNIQKIDSNIIYIDDEKRRNILDKGFVIDWTILSSEKNYFFPRKNKVTYLLGSEYTPLRASFKGIDRIQIAKEVETVFVSFGGADVRNLTPSVLKNLSYNFPNMKKNIVIGAGFTNIEEIKLFSDENTNMVFNANAEEMVSLMSESDIAISSGGQTLYELGYLGIPTISILLVENARDDTEGWAKVGAMDYIGNYKDKNLMIKLTESIRQLKSQEKRKNMHASSEQYIALDGGELIVNSILECSQ